MVMKVIRNKVLPVGNFTTINILGFLLTKEAEIDSTTLRHEAIHTAQQYEILALSAIAALIASNIYASWWYLLIVLVMPIALYVLAWLIALVLPPYDSAYKDSPFEREAYANQHYPMYLATRPPFAWIRYCKK